MPRCVLSLDHFSLRLRRSLCGIYNKADFYAFCAQRMRKAMSFSIVHRIVFVPSELIWTRVIFKNNRYRLSFLARIASCCSSTPMLALNVYMSSPYIYIYSSFLRICTIFPTVFPRDSEYNRTEKNRQ